MIDFACHCGYKFSVPQEMAGGVIQCPKCYLLADVPQLGDLKNIEKDGTFKVTELPPPDPEQAEALLRAYRRTDAAGNELDLRSTFEEVVTAGADEVPLELKDQVRPGAPKYDPETGELIEPMALRGDEAKRVIPIPQGPRTLQYLQDEPLPF